MVTPASVLISALMPGNGRAAEPGFVLECDLSQQIGGMPMQAGAVLVALGALHAWQRAAARAAPVAAWPPLSLPAPRTGP